MHGHFLKLGSLCEGSYCYLVISVVRMYPEREWQAECLACYTAQHVISCCAFARFFGHFLTQGLLKLSVRPVLTEEGSSFLRGHREGKSTLVDKRSTPIALHCKISQGQRDRQAMPRAMQCMTVLLSETFKSIGLSFRSLHSRRMRRCMLEA